MYTEANGLRDLGLTSFESKLEKKSILLLIKPMTWEAD